MARITSQLNSIASSLQERFPSARPQEGPSIIAAATWQVSVPFAVHLVVATTSNQSAMQKRGRL